MNVADLLHQHALQRGQSMAVAEPIAKKWNRRELPLDERYHCMTFAELDEDSSRLAAGLLQLGVQPGARMALMIPPSLEFISWVFALFKAGVVTVLIDPGMGRKNMIDCLQRVQTEGFIGISLAQALRVVMRHKFPLAKTNVTVGRRWFWGGPTADQLRHASLDDFQSFQANPSDPAAIIFTSGSTGPPKGVHYCHENFYQQAVQIQNHYDIQPGESDLPAFPLFGLFNAAMGVATIFPVMDPTRPAHVKPQNIIEPIQDWKISQSFGSPALWDVVGRYCEQQNIQLPSLKRILSAGAPVPSRVLQQMSAAMQSDGEMFTPYGATEALPVASISASEVLHETAALTQQGQGTCVGKQFSGIQWQVIQIDDDAITSIDKVIPVETGTIGELIVQGPVVTSHYVTHAEETRMHKIPAGETFWHRMGDVGYLDSDNRFWFCGRKTHRIQLTDKTLYSIPLEAIINQHPTVFRSALVGVKVDNKMAAVIVVQRWPRGQVNNETQEFTNAQLSQDILKLAANNPSTADIQYVLVKNKLPVDIRHNAKISREKVALWAQDRIPTK
jgi:acyl-CoA synthetase (AMP-forming)/AMP-acid ligase II